MSLDMALWHMTVGLLLNYSYTEFTYFLQNTQLSVAHEVERVQLPL